MSDSGYYHKVRYQDEDESHRLFCMRLLFKHIELFELWQKKEYPDKSLFVLTTELLEEMNRLDHSVNRSVYKKVVRNGKLTVSQLNNNLGGLFLYDLPALKNKLNKSHFEFYLYLYYMHKKLFTMLDNKKQASYADACFLHLITSEIIKEHARLNPEINSISYQREIAKLKEMFLTSENFN